jgi:hypothetical protein
MRSAYYDNLNGHPGPRGLTAAAIEKIRPAFKTRGELEDSFSGSGELTY